MKRFNRVLDLTSTKDASDTSGQRQNYDRAFWAWRRIANLGNPHLTQSMMSIECPSLGVGPLQESPKQNCLVQEGPLQKCLSQECPEQESPLHESPLQECPRQESPLQESPLQECPRQESPLHESAVQECARQEGTGPSNALFAQESSWWLYMLQLTLAAGTAQLFLPLCQIFERRT